MDRWDRSERSISFVLGAKFDEFIWIGEAGDSYFGMINSEEKYHLGKYLDYVLRELVLAVA